MMHSIGRYSQQMDFHRSILEYRFDETLKAGLAGRLPFEKEESHFAPEPSVACGIRADDTGDEFGVIYLQRSERLLVFAAAHAERASAAAVFKSAFPELSAHEIPATFKGGPLVDSPAPMNLPPPALEIPSALWRFELPGMILFFVVVIGSMYLAHAFQEPVMQWFGLHGGSPGDAPPWYYITQDFAEGICSAGVLLLCVLVAAVAWRWWPNHAVMMVWMPLMFHGGNISRSWIIHQACPGLLDGQRMTTRWPTFLSYLGDADIARARWLVLVTGLVLSIVLSMADLHVRRRLKRGAALRGMEGPAA